MNDCASAARLPHSAGSVVPGGWPTVASSAPDSGWASDASSAVAGGGHLGVPAAAHSGPDSTDPGATPLSGTRARTTAALSAPPDASGSSLARNAAIASSLARTSGAAALAPRSRVDRCDDDASPRSDSGPLLCASPAPSMAMTPDNMAQATHATHSSAHRLAPAREGLRVDHRTAATMAPDSRARGLPHLSTRDRIVHAVQVQTAHSLQAAAALVLQPPPPAVTWDRQGLSYPGAAITARAAELLYEYCVTGRGGRCACGQDIPLARRDNCSQSRNGTHAQALCGCPAAAAATAAAEARNAMDPRVCRCWGITDQGVALGAALQH